MFEKIKRFFDSGDDPDIPWAGSWRAYANEYRDYVLFFVGILFGGSGLILALALAMFVLVPPSNPQSDMEACVSELETYRGKEFDVEAQKRLVESVQTELAAKQAALDTAQAMIKSLEHELDTDDDKVKNVVDKCPNSPFPEGEPTYVNKNGCTYMESAQGNCAVLQQKNPSKKEEEEQLWLLTDCPLADEDEDLGFICTARWDGDKNVWAVFTDCHPEAIGG